MLRVYIDTSVFGGYYDEEFSADTQPFFAVLFGGLVLPIVSEAVATEIQLAPKRVKDLFRMISSGSLERLQATKAATRLAETYVREAVLSPKMIGDALHVAQATVAQADLIVSWNFRHMVNPAKMRAFNEVNFKEGYGAIVIVTPPEAARIARAQHGNQQEGEEV